MSVSTSDPSPEFDGPSSDQPGPPMSLSSPSGIQPDGAGGVRCETCGAPVALDQRYCVECGAHRVGVNDPASAYMNRSPGRAQRPTRAVVVSSQRSRLITALMLALIPISIGVGVLIGRSSNNQDPALLKAIKGERAQVVKVPSGAASVVTIPAGTKVNTTAAKAKSTKTKHSAAAATKPSAAVGAKPTKTQQKQSASIVKKLNKSTGQSYLDPITSQVGGG
jgi:hypothetical protein